MIVNKKKGIAILSAIIFMTIIIVVSGLLLTLAVSLNYKNTKHENNLEKFVTIQQIQNDFMDNGIIDNQYDYYVEVYNNSNTIQDGIQGLVVKKQNDLLYSNLICYFVYDFDNQKVLAFQTENFYLTVKNIEGVDFYYLADLVKYMEV